MHILLFVFVLILALKLVRVILSKRGGKIDTSNEISVKGKIIIVTGASSGIGKAATVELAKRDANVIMACRNVHKAKDVVNQIRKQTSRGQLIVMELDLASLQSVRNFCKEFKEKYDKLDILINNAGVIIPNEKRMKTKDNFEIHFGVNHLGHFLLTNLLLDSLKNASPSRIVNVGSMAHKWGSTKFEDIVYGDKDPEETHKFLPKNYGTSKLANALFNVELAKRLQGTGVKSYCLCPGMVYTDIGNDLSVPFVLRLLAPALWYFLKTPEEGALTVLYCALSKNLANESGLMYQNCKYWEPESRVELKDHDASRLWALSEKLVNTVK